MSTPKKPPDDAKPRILKITLGGVTLWERGEQETGEELERRVQRGIEELHRQTGLPPPALDHRRQGYAGEASDDDAPAASVLRRAAPGSRRASCTTSHRT